MNHLHVFRFVKGDRVTIVSNSTGKMPGSPFAGGGGEGVEVKLVHGVVSGTGIGARTWCGINSEPTVDCATVEEDVTCPFCVKAMRLHRGYGGKVWFNMQP